jgi:glycine cleavage system P protein (glycine dehydrogenase) subunit 1
VKFLPVSPAEREEMLRAIGVPSVDALFASVPERVRVAGDLRLPPPASEIEVRRLFSGLASRNASAREYACFLGAGCYNHSVPAVADQMILREEWLTAYTPYQAEVAQGTLQAIFEWQTHIALMTGLDVANASMYDGASALAEALLMAERLTEGRDRVVLSAAIHPEYRETVHTHLANLGIEVVEIPVGTDGRTDAEKFSAAADRRTFAVALQSPNFFGVVEDWSLAAAAARASGALSVGVVAEAFSLALLKPPGEFGVDIVCGEGQGFGVPMQGGGPSPGFLACRDAAKRQLPGRLAGQTVDAHGDRAFCLTLSTREQHIRRERATSNICTNQGLMALLANLSLTLLGRRGLRETALHCAARAKYLKARIAATPGCRIVYSGPIFNEFCVELPEQAADAVARLAGQGILAGVPLARWFPERGRQMLVAVTELNTRQEMDRLVSALAGEAEGS